MSVASRVRQFARRHDLWHADTRVVAAVSGGADSVAQLWLLVELQSAGELQLVALVHLNHQLRAAADRDERFCRELASRVGVLCISESVDVATDARVGRLSLELAAREARLRFFARVASEQRAVVAVAHTRDDQAETVLLRLLRGTGTRGLGGMAPRQEHRIRPLLDTTRAELRQYLVARNEKWCEDDSNADVAIPRNRVRHELLPYLTSHFNPAARDALVRVADLSRADEAWLSRAATEAAVGTIQRKEGETRLHLQRLRALPDAIAGRVVQQALAGVRPSPRARAADVVRVLDVVWSRRRVAGLSGVRAELSGEFVVLHTEGRELRSREARRHEGRACGAGGQSQKGHRGQQGPEGQKGRGYAAEVELSIPGRVTLPWAGMVMSAHLCAETPPTLAASGDEVHVDSARVTGPLTIRGRRNGDWLRPVGLGGRKKLQDLLTDRKVPRAERDSVPIVTDKTGQIVWVGGHALADDYAVMNGRNGVIVLKLARL